MRGFLQEGDLISVSFLTFQPVGIQGIKSGTTGRGLSSKGCTSQVHCGGATIPGPPCLCGKLNLFFSYGTPGVERGCFQGLEQ